MRLSNHTYLGKRSTRLAAKLSSILCAWLVVALIAPPNQVHAKPAKDSGTVWKFSFERGLYSAPSTVYIAKDALKIVTQGGYEVVAKAPDWTATVYRCNQKAYCYRTMKEWKAAGFFVSQDESGDLDPRKAITDVKTTFMGLPARRMSWKTVEQDDYYQQRSKAQPATTQMVQTTDVPCTRNQIDLLTAWYGFPYLTGVPLQVQRRTVSKVIYPHKLEFAEKLKASQVSFDLDLKGCKKVAQMRDLIPHQIKDTMLMMFGEGEEGENNKKGTSPKASTGKPPKSGVK